LNQKNSEGIEYDTRHEEEEQCPHSRANMLQKGAKRHGNDDDDDDDKDDTRQQAAYEYVKKHM